MFDSEVSGYDPDAVLEALDQVEAVAGAAEVHRLRLAARWADLHGTLGDGSRVMPGCERMGRLGGQGTPRVAEFAAAELGSTLATSTSGARMLLADALDLRHRLPRLWARTQAGQVKPWVARRGRAGQPPLPARARAPTGSPRAGWRG